MQALGTVVFVIGIALLIGNVTGKFRTFPFAGGIVMAIGGVMMRSGN